MNSNSEVSSFYKDRTIFVTGSTGFMGKMLLWKLLKYCSQLRRIYVLLRDKKGKSANQRLEELLNDLIFAKFWDQDVSVFKKVVAVGGDVKFENFGLNNEMKKTITNEVEIVFHLAATTNMNHNLRDAINMNTLGTLNLLKLATEMKNLIVFVHTSTAFCHCDIDVLEERVYPPADDPIQIIQLVNEGNDSTKDYDNIWHPHPNTYTYSKRLAEKLVTDYYPRLPVVIIRPSIVITSLREPIPGWSSSLHEGMTGIMASIGTGIIRSIEGEPNYHFQLMPVDAAICFLIVVAWKVSVASSPPDIPVYNLTQGDRAPVTWKLMAKTTQENARLYPFEKCIWYPRTVVRTNKITHTFVVWTCQWVPAYLIDLAMLLFGQKTFMVKVQKRIQQGFNVFSYFMLRNWHFKNDKAFEIFESLNEEDLELYYNNPDHVDNDVVAKNAILHARQYLLKEDPASLPFCEKKMKIMYAMDKFVSFAFYAFVLWMLYRILFA